jgi:hypothetical protein
MFLNKAARTTLGRRVTTLNRTQFPNGSFRQGPHFDRDAAYAVHFNFNTGHAKRAEMEAAGLWFLDAQGDTPPSLLR